MAHISMNFFSQTLGVGVSVEILYPADARGQIGTSVPSGDSPPAVLYLLHGLSDDHTAWTRNTSIERYAREYNLAVVMPAVNRSFYRDMAYGPAYWTYVSEELPGVISRTLRLSNEPGRTFVAGLSMGGYGAMMHAFSMPDRYAAAGSFSGALDLARRFDEVPDDPAKSASFVRQRQAVFGETKTIAGTEHDLFERAVELAGEGTRIPALFISCGTEDFLFDSNERFHTHLESLGIEHRYQTESGQHEWSLWDQNIEQFLQFLHGRGLLE
jgi:S-formylglutathione hydrolase FrmB